MVVAVVCDYCVTFLYRFVYIFLWLTLLRKSTYVCIIYMYLVTLFLKRNIPTERRLMDTEPR